MTAHYSQAEIVELSMSIGSWLAFGRLNHVLGLDTACVLPSVTEAAPGPRTPGGDPDTGRGPAGAPEARRRTPAHSPEAGPWRTALTGRVTNPWR